jgi:hypothetical protein
MAARAGEWESAGLRYLDAGSVRCPAGALSEFRVCTEDSQVLGRVEGVLLSPSEGRIAYLVLLLPGFLVNRRYLLPIEAGAIVEDEARRLRVPARRADLDLRTFEPHSVPDLTGGELRRPLYGEHAA